ncbi:MAG: hypothetical protein BWY74_02422 [Firmicutes bacterium ADurb.Bin419]|nr:MAG: hypothetical protein BWY74_02422 [Firmicutes bacterium ADurb.Bin419]
MEIERVCFNCNYFMQDEKDFDTGYGACMFDMEKFEPFVDEIFEENDFSSCMEEYNRKRLDGETDACQNYEQAEITEIDPNATIEEIDWEIKLFALRTQSVEGYLNLLRSENLNKKSYAINELSRLLFIGNKMAYDALLDYFVNSEPARTIEEVHVRVKLIEVLQHNAKVEELIEHYIGELLKTPSNNTTRQIYLRIFDYFERCDVEIVRDPLISYLERGKCSQKLRAKVQNIINREIRYPFPF